MSSRWALTTRLLPRLLSPRPAPSTQAAPGTMYVPVNLPAHAMQPAHPFNAPGKLRGDNNANFTHIALATGANVWLHQGGVPGGTCARESSVSTLGTGAFELQTRAQHRLGVVQLYCGRSTRKPSVTSFRAGRSLTSQIQTGLARHSATLASRTRKPRLSSSMHYQCVDTCNTSTH